MEEKMKNLFEYLKEIYELKTRVILDYKKLLIEIRDLSMTLLTDTQNNNELSNSIQIVLDKCKEI